MAIDRSGQDAVFSEARAYERFMGRWSRSLAPLFVGFAGVSDGDSVLDVGSGTGALTSAIAKAASSSRVVGIDPAAPYVALAKSQQESALISFEVGDAQHMRFEAARFDRTLSLLVVNFIPDARKALGEMKRVTKPGGTIAAAVWDYGDGMQMLRVFWDEAVALDPMSAAKDERNMPFCRRGELAALWQQLGLRDVVEEGLTIETRFASFDDFWTPFLEKQGPAGLHGVARDRGAGSAADAFAEAATGRWSRQTDHAACARLGCTRHCSLMPDRARQQVLKRGNEVYPCLRNGPPRLAKRSGERGPQIGSRALRTG
jgi:SAM-dependent methyltransferase